MSVNFIHDHLYVTFIRDLQFKDDSERQIFEQHFMAILFTLRVFARYLKYQSPKKYFFSHFILMPDLGYESGFSSTKPAHYLLESQNMYETLTNINTLTAAVIFRKLAKKRQYDFFTLVST